MKLSSVKENEVVSIDGDKAIVVSRDPEDRSSGVTTVQFENGRRNTYVWDRDNPEVMVLGRGELVSEIRLLTPPIDLIQKGDFKLASGRKSTYKIECDALSCGSWDGIAAAVMEEKLIGVPFSTVVGVPRGGVPFADAMRPYCTPGCNTLLICEDIITTGGSIEKFRREHVLASNWDAIRGVCFIARGKCPDWIVPLLQMSLPKLA